MKKGFIAFIFSVLIIAICVSFSNPSKSTEENTLEDINYTESLETFNNPERGFYNAKSYNFKPSGNTVPKSSDYKYNLVHLRLSIASFSKAVNGTEDIELTEDMLDTFDTMLKLIKENGGTAIVRFAYDDYFDGKANQEPSMDMILRHIEQLGPVLHENKDVISYIELGFFGPWGEMHTSTICTYTNVNLAIDAMLKSAPEEITIGVRHPGYYTSWKNIDRNTMNLDLPEKGTDAYRVGLFNDGYLGSHSDLGTFKNREIETAWLQNQATHTFYGGEVTTSGEPNIYNKTAYISKEGFITHTTYLNSGWNQAVQNVWKEEIYNGEDELYKGQTGYKYISNHLGYRFVVRESYIKDVAKNEKLQLNLKIENVGFANLINQKQLTIVLEKDDQIYEIKTGIDARKWYSKETSEVPISITLPEDIELGEWNVYVRISKYGDLETDNNYQAIRFANVDIWNDELASNYVGNVVISEAKEDNTEAPEEPKNPDEDDEENKPSEDDNNKEDKEQPDDDKKDEEKQPEIPDSDDNIEQTPSIPKEPETTPYPNQNGNIFENEDTPNTYDRIVVDTIISVASLIFIVINIAILLIKNKI